MATFLSMCQDVDKYIGTQGAITTVVGVTGYQALLVQYVVDAWIDIQNRRKAWDFMKRVVLFNIVLGDDRNYSIAEVHGIGVTDDPVSTWDLDSFYFTETNTKLRYKEPIDFLKMDQALVYPYPTDFTIYENPWTGELQAGADYLGFGRISATKEVSATYFRKAQVLSADADEPIAPVEYHSLIVHQATADLASYLGNIEVYDSHSAKAENQFGDLLRSQNPGLKAIPPRFI